MQRSAGIRPAVAPGEHGGLAGAVWTQEAEASRLPARDIDADAAHHLALAKASSLHYAPPGWPGRVLPPPPPPVRGWVFGLWDEGVIFRPRRGQGHEVRCAADPAAAPASRERSTAPLQSGWSVFRFKIKSAVVSLACACKSRRCALGCASTEHAE